MSAVVPKVVKMASSQKPKTPQLTHFLCIPLVGPVSRPQLSTSLASFKDDVTRPKDLGGFDLPPEAVRPVGTLHLTLGMMSFPGDSERLDRAVKLLRLLKPREILSGVKRPVMPGADASAAQKEDSTILLTLKGLNSMQKPEKSTIMYAPPSDPEGVLQEFAESVKASFKDAGLLAPDDRPLLLHATVVNTIYVKGSRNSWKGRKWDRKLITDAQGILDRYEDHTWMQDVPLDKIAICKMNARPIIEDGIVMDAAYEVEEEIDF